MLTHVFFDSESHRFWDTGAHDFVDSEAPRFLGVESYCFVDGRFQALSVRCDSCCIDVVASGARPRRCR
ncbi:hypothetical protein EAH68_14585 [Corynebacterium hylobatis]|uniref:Uncharacterized protein n=1 Tax=Corynebacterium hylobatis TaxID=1859290 RepID=A0A3S0BEC7_9CORY|nr:hypothetical protein EAH68_14585 [Corynebacterium hylobatis]